MRQKCMMIAGCLLFIAGAAIFCYPFFMNNRYGMESRRRIETYRSVVAQASVSGEAHGESPDQQPGKESYLHDLDKLYREMAAYNITIYETGQAGLQDPFAYEETGFDLSAYGFRDNMIGYLSIPAMELELPVYLGATGANMKKGAALLGQTSMPVGGVNTNVVLAAHRGYHGIPMFREIQKLQIGHRLSLTTPWSTLNYEVRECKVIEPEDVDEILIQPGKDMLTLITCHPYRENKQRYIVYCERTGVAETK